MSDLDKMRFDLRDLKDCIAIARQNTSGVLYMPLEYAESLLEMIERLTLRKRPVAWRVLTRRGFILFDDEEAAAREAEASGNDYQGLYVRDAK